MGVDDDINQFEEWAQCLGLPPKSLPPKKVLSRIFMSGKMQASFNDMMQHIRPMQEVKMIRDELKVRHVELLNGKIDNIDKKQSRELYLFETKKKLKDRIEQLNANVQAKKKEYNRLAVDIKRKSIEKMQIVEEVEESIAQNAIFNLKMSETERQLTAEKELSQNIDEMTPVLFTLENSNEKYATAALATAKTHLNSYYDTADNIENYDVNAVNRDQLWSKMRESFANIPRCTLFNGITAQMKQQLSKVEALSKIDMEKILYSDTSDGDAQKTIHIEIGKLYAEHVKISIRQHGVKQRGNNITNDYVVYYESFLNDLRSKFAMYNHQDIDEEFLAEYLEVYSQLQFSKGQLAFLERKVSENEQEMNQRKKVLDDYRVADIELSNIYNGMEDTYIRVHKILYDLVNVREKIQHSEDLMKYLLQCKKGNLDSSMPLNSTGNSSYSSEDSVLYNSRSDSINSTGFFGRSDSGIQRQAPAPLSCHLVEAKQFLETPIEKFKLRNPLHGNFDLCANPTVKTKIYDQLPDEVKSLFSDHLITPFTAIKQMKSQMSWLNEMESLNDGFVPPTNLTQVDEAKLVMHKNRQNDVLAQLTDEATAMCANIDRIYENIERYVKFIEENPLKKWVPKNEVFNGRTFFEYEREFMMYYDMIKKPNAD